MTYAERLCFAGGVNWRPRLGVYRVASGFDPALMAECFAEMFRFTNGAIQLVLVPPPGPSDIEIVIDTEDEWIVKYAAQGIAVAGLCHVKTGPDYTIIGARIVSVYHKWSNLGLFTHELGHFLGMNDGDDKSGRMSGGPGDGFSDVELPAWHWKMAQPAGPQGPSTLSAKAMTRPPMFVCNTHSLEA